MSLRSLGNNARHTCTARDLLCVYVHLNIFIGQCKKSQQLNKDDKNFWFANRLIEMHLGALSAKSIAISEAASTQYSFFSHSDFSVVGI
jgi:hypothetical protein